MNVVYPKALDAIGRAGINLESVTLKLMLLDSSYTYAATDDFLNDVPAGARISSGVAVAGTRTMTSGVLITGTPLTTMTAVAVNADDVAAMIMYVDTGSEATSNLVAYWTNQTDTTLISFATDNGNVSVTFPSGRLLRI